VDTKEEICWREVQGFILAFNQTHRPLTRTQAMFGTPAIDKKMQVDQSTPRGRHTHQPYAKIHSAYYHVTKVKPMKGSLRITHFGFLISVIVAVLIIGISLDASAQGNEVVCPCDFESVPMTTGCWTDSFETEEVEYSVKDQGRSCSTKHDQTLLNPVRRNRISMGVGIAIPDVQISICVITEINQDECGAVATDMTDITPEEVLACQCELLAYTTALNEVAGISVSGGPPYECGNVDCRQKVLTPIPTLNEYGMIITAGVLGLLAVIGLFVIRRRKAVA